ncbi:stalk domain-containing protein [Paenibacillus mendelii]|uniref:Stalk domain-containing protein n=1 Tax=Paenibacillus mendelii TaxID=206163 RepID=A0ABV6J9N0_9BACL|nr:stalk domain-containing protein [Paenibacillus mendelii]MCQ6563799.1 copper amine oxidase N-terminal domain-containing protein [Paenibacillus mendelii]
MRKRSCVILLCLLAFGLLTNHVFAAEPTNENKLVPEEGEYGFFVFEIGSPTMIFNGKTEEIDPDFKTAPLLIKGTTLLPIRIIIEKLGGTLKWDEAMNTIDIKYNGKSITLQIGHKTALVDNEEKMLHVEAVILKNRTMIPLRFVAESLGLKVYWHGDHKISISTNALKDTFSSDRFSTEDLSIYDAVLKKQIRLGMAKKEIDNWFGFQPEKDYMGTYNYEGLEVYYRDGKAAGLMVSSGNNLSTRFSTVRNVNLLTTKKEVQQKYGVSVEKDSGDSDLYATFIFLKEDQGVDGSLVKLESLPLPNEPMKNKYYISFLFNGNKQKTISHLLISDFEFAMYSK